MLNLDEKQLKSINSRSNLKKFLEQVVSNNVDKVTKMCTKGLDPNFHCQDSGGRRLNIFLYLIFFARVVSQRNHLIKIFVSFFSYEGQWLTWLGEKS